MSQNFEPLKEHVKNLLDHPKVAKFFDGEKARCWCVTCGKVFLDMPYVEFAKKKSFDGAKPDKWMIQASIHWIETNREHQIVSHIPYMGATNLSELFRNEMLQRNISFDKELMLRERREYLAEEGGKLLI